MADEPTPNTGDAQNNDKTASSDGTKSTSTSTTAGGGANENYVPQHRFNEVNRQKRDLEQRLSKIEADQQQQEEERAKRQGEFESLANKYKTQVDAEKQKRQAAENKLVRYQRLTTWRQAARGIILDDALDHAFDDLTEEDFGNTDETDVAAMTRLAEIVADRRPYMADGPRGAGSGFGSRTPVLERSSVSRQPQQNGAEKQHKPMFAKRKRRSWK